MAKLSRSFSIDFVSKKRTINGSEATLQSHKVHRKRSAAEIGQPLARFQWWCQYLLHVSDRQTDISSKALPSSYFYANHPILSRFIVVFVSRPNQSIKIALAGRGFYIWTVICKSFGNDILPDQQVLSQSIHYILSWGTEDEEDRRGKGGQRQREAWTGVYQDEHESDQVTATTTGG